MSTQIFSVLGLVAWLEQQDPETEYNYFNRDDCLLCRYFRARGVPLNDTWPLSAEYWTDKFGKEHLLTKELDEISSGCCSSNLSHPHCYGAALARGKEKVL